MVRAANRERHAEKERLGKHQVAVITGHQAASLAQHQRRVGDAGESDDGRCDGCDRRMSTQGSPQRRFRAALPTTPGEEQDRGQDAEPGADRHRVGEIEGREPEPPDRGRVTGHAEPGQANQGEDEHQEQQRALAAITCSVRTARSVIHEGHSHDGDAKGRERAHLRHPHGECERRRAEWRGEVERDATRVRSVPGRRGEGPCSQREVNRQASEGRHPRCRDRQPRRRP